MANIKIAQLTNQTSLSDADLMIIESATSTNKMTVGKFKELLHTNVEIVGSERHNGLEKVLFATKGQNGGANVFASVYNSPQTGRVYVIEKNTDKYLIAELYKASASSIVQYGVVISNGLSIAASNAVGTLAVNGFTDPNNAVFYVEKQLLGNY